MGVIVCGSKGVRVCGSKGVIVCGSGTESDSVWEGGCV